MHYRVFLNAPTSAFLKQKTAQDTFHWQTASSDHFQESREMDKSTSSPRTSRTGVSNEASAEDYKHETQDWLLLPATLGAASQRISEMYKNVIFPDDEEVDEEKLEIYETIDEESGLDNESRVVPMEESFISWPPTNARQTRSRTSLSRALIDSQFESREYSEETSYAHTSTSSITAFPTFVINLHTLTSLPDLASILGKWTRKVNLLVAVLEIDGPDVVKIKKGPDAGREVSVLKLVIGGEEGGVCKLTAWREVANLWGGVGEIEMDESTIENERVKRGDVVYLENILASSSQASPDYDRRSSESYLALTASLNLAPRLHICYRTLPTEPSDRKFRPDLRLAASDPGLRKVAIVVRWLEGMMGLGSA